MTIRGIATRSPASTSTRRRCSRWVTAASRSSCSGKASPEHSLLKLFGSESLQRALLYGSEALGVEGLNLDRLGPRMWREGPWAISYLRSFSGTIPGGTSEIQRNIIAERVLGLPRRAC